MFIQLAFVLVLYPQFGRHFPLAPGCWTIRAAAVGGHRRQLIVLNWSKTTNPSRRSENVSRQELAFLTSCSISSCVSLSAAGLGCGLEGERLVMSFSGSGDLLLLNKRRMTVELLVAFGDLLATSPSVSELEIRPKDPHSLPPRCPQLSCYHWPWWRSNT